VKNISAAFVKAKRAFGPALKDKNNPHFKSKYADLGACIEAVEPALLDNGIAFIQETFEDASGVTVETVFLHESGEERRCGKLHVPAAKNDPQGFGSALTYARRYSLMAACGIAPEDDDGNAATKAKAQDEARRAAQMRAAWLDGQAEKLENCVSADELQAVWKAAYKVMHAENDADAIATLTAVKDRIKLALEAA
jgi:hypothetical protein